MVNSFVGRTAVVTGGTSGIGYAIAMSLAAAGATVHGVGRRAVPNEHTNAHAGMCMHRADLTNENDIRHLAKRLGSVHILVHSAGVIKRASFLDSPVEDFDLHYKVNMRAPFLLTQMLLPGLIANKGQVVFIHSSADRPFGPNKSQYAASKHGLVALAECLRDEVKTQGVRVLNVFLGRVATPMQESVYLAENKPYEPELLIQPKDVADTITHALSLPPTAEAAYINIRATI